MLKTKLLQCVDPINAKRLTVFIQRDLEIEAWMKCIDMIANVIPQRLPNVHGGKAQGNFNRITSEAPYTTGIHARSVSRDVVLFKKGDVLPTPGQKICSGAALYSPANNNDSVFTDWHLHAPAQRVHPPSKA